MYQFILGSLLGMELKGDHLHFKPCFPLEWPSVSITYKYGTSIYKITVFQKEGGIDTVALTDDGQEHIVNVYATF
jgi:cellobiose phosphorylase